MEGVLHRVLQGQARGDHYSVLGVTPAIGGEEIRPEERMRAFLVGRTMKKKLFCNENQWNWVVFLKKLMNMFTGDLYSMYVVLQGIGSLPCMRVCIISVIPFGK